MSRPSNLNPATERFRCLVLDFDGVILESVQIKTEAFGELFARYEDTVDAIVNYHLENNGVSRFIKFKYICRELLGQSFDASVSAKLNKKFSAIVYRRLLKCPFVSGARDLLSSYANTVPIYVASASPDEELKRVIGARELDGFFTAVYGHPVNKRDVIKRALAEQRLQPHAVAYVGDSVKDFEAARAEGVFFIGRRNEEDLEGLAVPLFDDLAAVHCWLASRIPSR